MKKIITLLFLLMMTSTILKSQTEHLKFKGIPLEGPLDSFVQKLKEQGYRYIGIKDGCSVLEGNFAGVDNSLIYVTCMGLGYRVTGTIVMFPESNHWNDLLDQYESFKESLTTKYGEPKECDEIFPEYAQSDEMKLFSIKNGSGKYITSFNVENGSIGLTLVASPRSGVSVAIMYLDKSAIEGKQQKMMDDL